MKRSRAVAALLLGGVTPLLIACGEDAPQEAAVYPSLSACMGELPAEECRAAFAAAHEEHEASAPRFTSRQECEAEMGEGACTATREARDGGFADVFVPAFVGFMIGRSLGGSYAQPVYFDREGYARSGGMRVGRLPAGAGGTAGAGAGAGAGGGSYYYRGGSGGGGSLTVARPGRNAGFGATGAARGFSGS